MTDFNVLLGLFREKLKAVLLSLNIFTLLAVVVFFSILVPYVTLIGNAMGPRLNNLENQALTEAEKACDFNVSQLLQERSAGYSEAEKDRLQEIQYRIEKLNTPIFGPIPASTGEIVILFPAIVPAYLGIVLLQIAELIELERLLWRVQSERIAALRIRFLPRLRIAVMLSIDLGLYYWMRSILATRKINQCDFLSIIVQELPYRQSVRWYALIHGLSCLVGFSALMVLLIKVVYPGKMTIRLPRIVGKDKSPPHE